MSATPNRCTNERLCSAALLSTTACLPRPPPEVPCCGPVPPRRGPVPSPLRASATPQPGQCHAAAGQCHPARRTGLNDGRWLSRPSATVSSIGPVKTCDGAGTAGLADASGATPGAVSAAGTAGDSVGLADNGGADGVPVWAVVGASDGAADGADGAAV